MTPREIALKCAETCERGDVESLAEAARRIRAFALTLLAQPEAEDRNAIIEECAKVVEARAGTGPYAESMGAHRILVSAADAVRSLKRCEPQRQPEQCTYPKCGCVGSCQYQRTAAGERE